MRGNFIKKTADLSLLGTILIAVLGLIAYIPGLSLLGSLRPQYIPMAPSTAIFFISLGGIFIADISKMRKWQGYLGITAASIVSVFGFLKFLEYSLGIRRSFEEIIIGETPKLGEIPIAIMSPATGCVFFLAGLAAIAYLLNGLNKQERKFFGHLAEISGCAVFTGGLVFILGYIYRAPLLYGAGRIVPMAITTAVAFSLLGIGQILTAGEKYFPLMLFSGSGTRAKLMRAFVPLISIAVLLTDIIHHFPSEYLISHPNPLIAAVIAVLFLIIAGFIAIRIGDTVSKSIGRAENERARLQMELIQSAKLASIGQLSSSLTHGLSSPLMGLLNLIESYRDKAQPGSREYEDFSVMLDGIQHMIKIVKDMGAFTRKSEGVYVEIHLNKVIESTLDFFRAQLFKNNIELTERYSKNLPKIKGDKNQLQQVILNMVTNASDAMPDGGRLTIVTRNSEDRANVIIEFIDTGVGIKEEYLDKIFNSFFTTKEPGKGVGLGLSIAKRIIAEHKGSIDVESNPGKGTKFTISLPAVKKGA
jgi:signal transduction histidine kinase